MMVTAPVDIEGIGSTSFSARQLTSPLDILEAARSTLTAQQCRLIACLVCEDFRQAAHEATRNTYSGAGFPGVIPADIFSEQIAYLRQLSREQSGQENLNPVKELIARMESPEYVAAMQKGHWQQIQLLRSLAQAVTAGLSENAFDSCKLAVGMISRPYRFEPLCPYYYHDGEPLAKIHASIDVDTTIANVLAGETTAETVRIPKFVPTDALRDTREATAEISADPRVHEFARKYDITIPSESQISLTLLEGMTRMDFLHEAQDLAREVHGTVAVHENLFKDASPKSRYNTPLSSSLSLAIDLHVKGSLNKDPEFVTATGMEIAPLDDLQVAHAAFYVMTGVDPIGKSKDGRGILIRARDKDEKLGFWPSFGSSLHCTNSYDGKSYAGVALSANLNSASAGG